MVKIAPIGKGSYLLKEEIGNRRGRADSSISISWMDICPQHYLWARDG